MGIGVGATATVTEAQMNKKEIHQILAAQQKPTLTRCPLFCQGVWLQKKKGRERGRERGCDRKRLVSTRK